MFYWLVNCFNSWYMCLPVTVSGTDNPHNPCLFSPWLSAMAPAQLLPDSLTFAQLGTGTRFCLTHTKLPPQVHTANATPGINRCCQPLPYKSSSPFLCRVLALTSELLWGHTTVTVSGQSPGWRADAVVGPWGVDALAVLTVGWVLALVYIWKETKIHS